jgi:hypothetical protein
MMRTLFGVLLGLLLIFPGCEIIKLLCKTGIYDSLTPTDCFLAMIIILLSVNLVRGSGPLRSRARTQARRPSRSSETYPEAQLEYLPSERAIRERRRPTSRRRTSRRDGEQ